MHVTTDVGQIEPACLSLADLGWDHGDVRGDHEVAVELDAAELYRVGSRIYDLRNAYEQEEPTYFEDLIDVPVPTSPDAFVQRPVLLGEYLKEQFWSRATILAILDLARDEDADQHQPEYLICDLRGIECLADGGVLIRLGAVRARSDC